MFKAAAKLALQRTNLFPMARLAYRRFNPGIAALRHREIKFYKNLLAPGSLVFDVGANLGQKSDVFLAAGFHSIVIEPNRHCEGSLRVQFANNKKAIIVGKAVGRSAGPVDLFANGTDAAASLIYDWHDRVYGSPITGPPQRVEMVTLDQLIAEYGCPDYIKIDVEGFENEVLLGLTQAVKLLSLEFHFEMIDATAECLATIAKLKSSFMMRASDMFGRWISTSTNDVESMLKFISETKSNGDLYVWMTR